MSVRRRAETVLRGGGGAAGGLARALLLPAEGLFRLAVAARGWGYAAGVLPTARAPVPVLSVGNLAVGGAGKTPVVGWIVDELIARGCRPAVLHGGYAPDEPALHRQWHPDVPVVAERDRVAGAERAVAAGADVLVLDDGFQHRRLARDADVVLVAAETWTPRPRLLPRGAWREPLAALDRADLVVVTRRTASAASAARVAAALRTRLGRRPSARARDRDVVVVALEPGPWRDRSGDTSPPPSGALAVAGVAAPDLFFRNAAAAGAEPGGTLAFPDHHAYTPADAALIRERAGGGPVMTTGKDAVKLAPLAPDLDLRILEQRVVVERAEPGIRDLLDAVAGLAGAAEARGGGRT